MISLKFSRADGLQVERVLFITGLDEPSKEQPAQPSPEILAFKQQESQEREDESQEDERADELSDFESPEPSDNADYLQLKRERENF